MIVSIAYGEQRFVFIGMYMVGEGDGDIFIPHGRQHSLRSIALGNAMSFLHALLHFFVLFLMVLCVSKVCGGLV